MPQSLQAVNRVRALLALLSLACALSATALLSKARLVHHTFDSGAVVLSEHTP